MSQPSKSNRRSTAAAPAARSSKKPAAAKKAPARKATAAKKAPAPKKTPARKAPAKKVPAKKAPATKRAAAKGPTVRIPKASPSQEGTDEPRCAHCDGQVAREVRKLIDDIDLTEHKRFPPLAALALSLAGQIDTGADLRTTAPVTRELTALIQALVGDDGKKPDGFDDWEEQLGDTSS